MAELQGELAFMPAVDLVRYLGNRGFSGTLLARRGPDEKRMVLLEGKAVQATSSDPREYVGQFLLHDGRLAEEQLERAFQAQTASRVPLGKLLVEGGLPEAVVREALELKIRETAIDLCSWSEGQFVVARSAARADESGVAVTPIPLSAIAAEAQARARQWGEIRKALPSGATRVERAASPTSRSPGSVDARILDLLAEARSIDEIGLFLHATEFQLYSRLLALLREGAIRLEREVRTAPAPVPAAAAKAPPPLPKETRSARPPGPADLPSAAHHLARARKALQAKAAEEAVTAAREAIGIDASGDTVAILRQAEGLLLESLRAELLASPSRPRATIDRARLRELPIPPPARYLLTRMNGARELGAIVRVAPMREVDALEIVKRMVRDGWVSL